MNMIDMDLNYKRYLIYIKTDAIKSLKNTIQEYKINIADLVLQKAEQSEINKYVKFIEKYSAEIAKLELEIANLIIEIDKLEKTE